MPMLNPYFFDSKNVLNQLNNSPKHKYMQFTFICYKENKKTSHVSGQNQTIFGIFT